MKKQRENENLNVINTKDYKKSKTRNMPRMPRGLSPDTKSWWRKLKKQLDNSLIQPCDRIALMLFCQSLADYDRLTDKINEVGLTYQTMDESGNTITLARPEVEITNTCREHILEMLKEFCLTPMSRREISS